MSENRPNENLGEELEDNIVILNDEEGKENKFEFLDLIELDNEEYVVLLPADEESDEPGEVVILKVEEILNKVFEIFKDKFKDEFDFVD